MEASPAGRDQSQDVRVPSVPEPPAPPARPGRRRFLREGVLRVVGVAAGLSLAATTRRSPAEPARADTPADPSSPFVQASGTGFVFQGAPFAVTGTNNHYLGWGSRAEVDDVLNAARRMGMNVVRTFIGCQVGSLSSVSPATVWDRFSTADSSNLGVHGTYVAYWDGGAGRWAWNDSTVNGLGRWDYVIARAGQLGIRLLPVLLDYWPFVGGAQQALTWWLPGYSGPGDARARGYFFSNATARGFYRDWTAHVLNRVNSITGNRYADEPAIFGWDLMNEPQIDNTITGPSGQPLAIDWLTAMSAHVRSIDPHHLITCGMEGFYDRSGVVDPDDVLSVPDLDFGCWHLYPSLYGLSSAEVMSLIRRHGAAAQAAGKPVLLEEFGSSDASAGQPVVYRTWLEALGKGPNRGGWTFWRLVGKVRLSPTGDFPEAEQEALDGYPPDTGGGYDLIADSAAASATQTRTVQVLERAAKG